MPVPVLEQLSKDVLEINGSGMSILEVSHRGKDYDVIHHEAMTNLLQTLSLSPDEYSVIFAGGGASLQFAMLPVNFLSAGQTADYVDTGEWSAKSIKEAKRSGNVNVVASSADTNYDRIPKDLVFSAPGTARYAHFTTNNTIEGTQFHSVPDANGAPLTADMSSDIFAINHDFSKFALIYAGAQKNAGPAGVTMVIAKKSFMETANKNVTPMLSYPLQADKESLYNTPPVFAIHALNLVLKHVQAEGGVVEMERRNREKAGLIYSALDAAPELYRPTVAENADRSVMNITFRLATEELEGEFLKEAKTREMDGLKGHRNVGGIRASIYNAFPREGCVALAEFLADFARRKG